jgi:hypothetical protein
MAAGRLAGESAWAIPGISWIYRKGSLRQAVDRAGEGACDD